MPGNSATIARGKRKGRGKKLIEYAGWLSGGKKRWSGTDCHSCRKAWAAICNYLPKNHEEIFTKHFGPDHDLDGFEYIDRYKRWEILSAACCEMCKPVLWNANIKAAVIFKLCSDQWNFITYPYNDGKKSGWKTERTNIPLSEIEAAMRIAGVEGDEATALKVLTIINEVKKD